MKLGALILAAALAFAPVAASAVDVTRADWTDAARGGRVVP